MIARKVAIDRLGLQDYEPALPLDTLDKNIVCQDALFTEWPKADAIIGNPPFLGGSWIRTSLGDDYAEKIFKKFSDIRAQIDFCSYWFRLTHQRLSERGRAGLVGTNSVSQGKSKSVTLDYLTNNGGFIHEAISSQPWSGEANVHVSIVNWSKQEPEAYYLDNQLVPRINPSLTSLVNAANARRLSVNLAKVFIGVQPNGMGFLIPENLAKSWIRQDPQNDSILKLFSMGANLAQNPNGKPERWIIDFANMDIENIAKYTLPYSHVKAEVKPEREKNREAVLREKWWRFKRTNEAMRSATEDLGLYFTVPRVSKWAVFLPAPIKWLPGDKSVVVASEDFYLFGILSSIAHMSWVDVQKSTLEDRTAYTPTTCFETFPFPQTPSAKIVQQIRAKALELHQYRSDQMQQKQWGITKLYNAYFHEPASQLYKLHKQLDALVLQAYGFDPTDDLLEKLLALNLALAAKEKRGEPVVGPWDPTQPPSEV